MMIDGARGSIHARDLADGGIVAYQINAQLVCLSCLTERETLAATLSQAVLDAHLSPNAGEDRCARCRKAFVSVYGSQVGEPIRGVEGALKSDQNGLF